MKMLFARAAVPGWVVILGLGALLAPAGIATTVLLVAMGLACIPAVISIGVWKRALPEPSADLMGVWHTARREPKAIDAEFVVEDVTPEKRHP